MGTDQAGPYVPGDNESDDGKDGYKTGASTPGYRRMDGEWSAQTADSHPPHPLPLGDLHDVCALTGQNLLQRRKLECGPCE
jgi:hypothetical protein